MPSTNALETYGFPIFGDFPSDISRTYSNFTLSPSFLSEIKSTSIIEPTSTFS